MIVPPRTSPPAASRTGLCSTPTFAWPSTHECRERKWTGRDRGERERDWDGRCTRRERRARHKRCDRYRRDRHELHKREWSGRDQPVRERRIRHEQRAQHGMIGRSVIGTVATPMSDTRTSTGGPGSMGASASAIGMGDASGTSVAIGLSATGPGNEQVAAYCSVINVEHS